MSALLYWTCGKEMADMLLANGDAKEAEKLIRSQIADFKYKFSKNQDVWASTYYAIYNEDSFVINIEAGQLEKELINTVRRFTKKSDNSKRDK